MCLENDSCINGRDLSCDKSQQFKYLISWQRELKQLIDQELADGTVYQFLLLLLGLLNQWSGFTATQQNHTDIGIQPAVDQLPELLRQTAGLLDNQDQKQLLLQLIDEAIRLVDDQSVFLIRRFKYRFLSYLTICEKTGKGECGLLITVTSEANNYKQFRLPVRILRVDTASDEIMNIWDSIVVNQQEYKLEQKIHQFQLGILRRSIIDLSFSDVKEIRFADCCRIMFLDISHTLICHLDIRQLIDLERLRLNNVNIRRLNLANSRKLRSLYCSYTLVDYLQLCGQSLLTKLRIEYSEQLKINGMGASTAVFIDERQTVDSYQCTCGVEKRKRYCDALYPYVKSGTKLLKITLPDDCNELIDRNIKQCKQLEIDSSKWVKVSVIDFFDIADYPNLRELAISYINCKHFSVTNLPSLASIKIFRSQMCSISIFDFPNLKEIKITQCDRLEQLHIGNCEKVLLLDISCIKVTQPDTSGLRELRIFDARHNAITQLDVSHNVRLEELYVGDTKISQLDVGRLAGLRRLWAAYTGIIQLNLFGNTELEELDVSCNKISRLDVSQLVRLKKLWVYRTSISQMDLSSNSCLAYVSASSSCRVLGCRCKVTAID